METNTIELLKYAREMAKDMSRQAEEIGRLRILNEMKDRTIAGLQASLGLGVTSVKPADTSSPSTPSISPMTPFYGPYCTSGYMRTTDDIMLASAKADLESTVVDMGTLSVAAPVAETSSEPVEAVVEVTPKRKCGRPKGSKNVKKSTEASVVTEVEETSVGGSVFKEFTPLSTGNLVTPNANAYIPKPKQDSVFSIVS